MLAARVGGARLGARRRAAKLDALHRVDDERVERLDGAHELVRVGDDAAAAAALQDDGRREHCGGWEGPCGI